MRRVDLTSTADPSIPRVSGVVADIMKSPKVAELDRLKKEQQQRQQEKQQEKLDCKVFVHAITSNGAFNPLGGKTQSSCCSQLVSDSTSCVCTTFTTQ